MPDSVGRYRIDRVLGSGAFASVWLAHDESLAASVAIKVLAGSLFDDLDVRNRFLEEARILHGADSDRLVRVHDIGELPDGRPYFVMSYADRGTLAERMRERPLSVSESLAIAEEIAYGVEDINRLGIIHRDLKPSNVLFQSTADGGERLLIADLGLAKALAHASGAFTLPVGTPGYMSPEQARFGGGLDVRADVYGLGALSYHLLTGRAPRRPPIETPPSRLRPELGPHVDHVIMRALEVERENRWPTAAAFGHALATVRMSAPGGPGGPGAAGAPPADSHGTPGPPPPPTPGPRQGPPPGAPQGPPPSGPPQAPPSHPPSDPPPGPYGRTGTRPMPQGPPGSPQESPDEIATSPLRAPRPGTGETVVDGNRMVTPGDTAVYPQPASPDPWGRRTPPESFPTPAWGVPRPPGRPEAPGGADPFGAPRAGGQGRRKRPLVPLAVGAVILALAVGGVLLLRSVFWHDAPPRNPGRGDQSFITVSDSTGTLTAAVPRSWPAQRNATWVPAEVALADTQLRPVLRATPNFTDFRNATGRTPGVFIGLTTDVAPGKLPPAGAAQHTQCVRGRPESYRRGTLMGTIIRFTRCTSGTPSISEIGLTDTAGRFGLWIRIKQVDGADLTNRILDGIRAKGP